MRSALSPDAAAALVPDGATVTIGGFMGVGSPHRAINALVERGARDLTVIAYDTARPEVDIGKLITAGCVARVIASHIGTNPETQRFMLAGPRRVDLVPQGTLAERIRAGGAGFGGVPTATGSERCRRGAAGGAGRGTRLSGRPALKADVAVVAARSAFRLKYRNKFLLRHLNDAIFWNVILSFGDKMVRATLSGR